MLVEANILIQISQARDATLDIDISNRESLKLTKKADETSGMKLKRRNRSWDDIKLFTRDVGVSQNHKRMLIETTPDSIHAEMTGAYDSLDETFVLEKAMV